MIETLPLVLEGKPTETAFKFLELLGLSGQLGSDHSLANVANVTQVGLVKNPATRKLLERWEVQDIVAAEAGDRSKLFQLLFAAGFIAEVKTLWQQCDVAGLLGCLARGFIERVRYFQQMCYSLDPLRPSKIVLFGGFRPAIPACSETPEEILKLLTARLVLRKGYGGFLSSCSFSTESEIMRSIVLLADMPQVQIEDVIAPMKLGPDGTSTVRPSLEDGLKMWRKTMTLERGRILMVSHQPFLRPQELMIREYMPPCFDLSVCGPAYDPKRQKLTIACGEVARFLWHHAFYKKQAA